MKLIEELQFLPEDSNMSGRDAMWVRGITIEQANHLLAARVKDSQHVKALKKQLKEKNSENEVLKYQLREAGLRTYDGMYQEKEELKGKLKDATEKLQWLADRAELETSDDVEAPTFYWHGVLRMFCNEVRTLLKGWDGK